MNRKSFIRKSLFLTAGFAAFKGILQAKDTSEKGSTYTKMMDQVGFNHLPNKEVTTMKTVLHKASSRGHANHGWLDSHHTFSFANYYNPERMNFGVLRVLNDDIVAGGKGFGRHPHDNMEIISIPIEGDLEHKDSMGNVAIIKEGDVQVMSAGTGIFHSEYNKNKSRDVKFLQIWLFPKKKNVEPRYDQISIRDIEKKDKFYQILSPNDDDQGVWIHQDAWFNLGNFNKGKSDKYKVKRSGNGVYAFVLNGEVEIEGIKLDSRDGLGIWDTDAINVKALNDAKVLLMDVPMNV